MTLRKLLTAPALVGFYIFGVIGMALLFIGGWLQDKAIQGGWEP